MLDIPSPGRFQNIGLLIWAQQGSEHVKPCGSSWVKLEGAQLTINLHRPIVHRMLTENGKRTMMIRCILTELLECKVHEKCLCLLMSALFSGTLSYNNSVRKHQIWWFFANIWSVFNALSVCATRFLVQLLQFLPDMNPLVLTRSEPSWPQI